MYVPVQEETSPRANYRRPARRAAPIGKKSTTNAHEDYALRPVSMMSLWRHRQWYRCRGHLLSTWRHYLGLLSIQVTTGRRVLFRANRVGPSFRGSVCPQVCPPKCPIFFKLDTLKLVSRWTVVRAIEIYVSDHVASASQRKINCPSRGVVTSLTHVSPASKCSYI